MSRDRLLPMLAAAAFLSAVPVALLHYVGHEPVHLPYWVHFLGVGITAGIATAAAFALTIAGAREHDGRAVVVGSAFSVMAALLLLHGITTPHLIFAENGVVAFTGAATLPLGGVILALSAVPALQRPSLVPRLLGGLAAAVVGIFGLGVTALIAPRLVPGVPAPKSTAALALLAAGLLFFLVLLRRAFRTFRLTRRRTDLAVVVGLVWLGAALVPSLLFTAWDLGWWLGHGFEVVGIFCVGGAVAVDLRRGAGRRSSPLVGDLRAIALVETEEAFLGSHVRALLVTLGKKDVSTEEHTRRVALRAVEVGEELGLSPSRLRVLATGGLLHDIGKLSVPDRVLRKPGPLTDEEFAEVKRHPENGMDLLQEIGGFPSGVIGVVRDHHERLDGSGYPFGAREEHLELEARILAVCDVYDALVSKRVYRDAWSAERAVTLLREGAGTQFDRRVVAALERVLAREQAAVLAPAA
jgi:putative nucleotidyltransferase with HDIG domain